MQRALFAPFSIGFGLVAGMIGKRIFAWLWSLVDDEDPPESEHRDVPWTKVLIAAALQGAIFRLTKIVVDRQLRSVFLNLTGTWPGEAKPDEGG